MIMRQLAGRSAYTAGLFLFTCFLHIFHLPSTPIIYSSGAVATRSLVLYKLKFHPTLEVGSHC